MDRFTIFTVTTDGNGTFTTRDERGNTYDEITVDPDVDYNDAVVDVVKRTLARFDES